jgi:hypothetical protein
MLMENPNLTTLKEYKCTYTDLQRERRNKQERERQKRKKRTSSPKPRKTPKIERIWETMEYKVTNCK